jgi:uncharacterized protein YgbK (DUF1537 family)
MTTTNKIVVLDDDPTGSQTVHSCLLLTQWDVETLASALLDDSSPLFFVLTNTRGMSPQKAADLTRQVCCNLREALASVQSNADIGREINPILVSRSDSTLRGHYPVETDVMAEELGPFDAHFLVPAFFEGGRVTRNSTHFLVVDGQETPCHETEFAEDSVFGYSTAYLPEYVAEKTRGRIQADHVERFVLEDIRADVTARLLGLTGNTCCVVDGERQSDLNKFAAQLQHVAATHHRRFLFRSAASLLTALAMLPPQPIPAEDMAQYVQTQSPGVVLVGSHVARTTEQLRELLKLDKAEGLEVEVERILQSDGREAMLKEVVTKVAEICLHGKHPVIYTSRTELVSSFGTSEARLEFGEQLSDFLMDIVRKLPPTIGFLISKGGITSNDVLSKGLELKTSRVLGQILPGCSVVKCPDSHQRYPDLPVVIFPGNVGDKYGLATVFLRLTKREGSDLK